MTKIFIVLAIVLALGGGWYFISSEKKEGSVMDKATDTMMQKEGETAAETSTQQDGSMMPKDGSMMEKTGDTMMAKGSYEPYAAAKLAMAEKGKVILFFRASWCPTCKALDADIKSHLGDIPAGVTILDVDYDNSTALKQKYGVTHQHTLVQVDAQRNQIAKWDASPTLASLLSGVK